VILCDKKIFSDAAKGGHNIIIINELLKAIGQDTIHINNPEQRKHLWDGAYFSIINKKVFYDDIENYFPYLIVKFHPFVNRTGCCVKYRNGHY
jgi:hypothetical protein